MSYFFPFPQKKIRTATTIPQKKVASSTTKLATRITITINYRLFLI